MKKVLVLGCGPAGLLAAHAASEVFRLDVRIISTKRKSQLFGCQYLHSEIPGLFGLVKQDVTYRVRGESEDYGRKVYGNRTLPVPLSPQLFAGVRPAWDIRAAYDQLWERYEYLVDDYELSPTDINPMMDHYGADLVVSTIPLPAICQRGDEHAFDYVKCWAMGDAPELGQTVPIPTEPFTVVCDGTLDVSWYRTANVFGYSTVEWPGERRKPPIEGVVPFLKPLTSTCDCLPDVLRAGRMGQWQKGILSHHVYAAVTERITAMMNGEKVQT